MNKEGEAGSAYCIYRASISEITNAKILLGRTAGVIGTAEGLKVAMSHCMAKYATNIVVCLENEEAALRTHTVYLSPSSSVKTAEFQVLREIWNSRVQSSREEEGAAKVQWVPGHAGIKVNKRADVLAKEACSETTTRTKASIYRAKSLIKERQESSITRYWKDHAPSSFGSLKILMTGQMPEELQNLSRKNLALILAARPARGDYATYHRRQAIVNLWRGEGSRTSI